MMNLKKYTHEQKMHALKKLSEFHDQQLKLLGCEISDLPSHLKAGLDMTAIMQKAKQVPEVNTNSMNYEYFIKKRIAIEEEMIIAREQEELKRLEEQMAANESEIATLERFLEKQNKRIVTEAQSERIQHICAAKTQGLLDRQAALHIPDEFHVEEMIERVMALQHHVQSIAK